MDWQVMRPIIEVALALYWVAIVIVMINDGREPTKTLAWILILALFPVLGLVFYFFLGRNWKKKTAKDPRVKQVADTIAPTIERYQQAYSARDEIQTMMTPSGFDDLARVIERTDGAVPMPAYDVHIMPSGAEKFAQLKKDLAAATSTINIQYFIWEHDELTADLTAILLERQKSGVEVRMLNDFVGNIQYNKEELRKLAAAGAKISYDVSSLGKANYRNHRKIVVIDGVLGYTGGINVGQEYIDGKPRYASWRDTHVRFHGPAVADLQKLFAMRWMEVEKEELLDERFFPTTYPTDGVRSLAHIVATGVEDYWESARRAHVVAMSSAQDHIFIQSPYFVPTSDIYETMVNAALSGIDVRFMMTGVPDKKIAFDAAETYFGPFVEAGGKIYRYTDGFFHAKTITIDGKVSAIGTMNFDIRSLELHKELMAWFYDDAIAAQMERTFIADMERCELITPEFVREMSGLRLFRNSAARLASELL